MIIIFFLSFPFTRVLLFVCLFISARDPTSVHEMIPKEKSHEVLITSYMETLPSRFSLDDWIGGYSQHEVS